MSYSTCLNLGSQALANSEPLVEIAQTTPDSSGVVGDTFENSDSTRDQELIDPLIIPQPTPQPIPEPVSKSKALTPIPGSTIGVFSAPLFEIAQTNPDSSGVVGDTFENSDSTRDQELIDPLIIPQPTPQPIPEPVSKSKALTPIPGSTIGVSSAYGAKWGDAYIGGAGAITDEDVFDATASVGFGLGDPQKSLGLEVGLGIASLFGDNAGAGLVGFKVHRALGKNTRIAAGWANAIKWDVANAGDTVYGSLTHQLPLRPSNQNNQLPLTVTIGAGTGAYRSIGSLKQGENTPNVFGSISLRVIPRLSLISSWTGSQLNVGTSITPFDAPITLNLAATDITSNRDVDGRLSRTGFLMSTGYVFKF